MVNPPAAHKYCHWTNAELPTSADEWLAGAQRHDGSWWPEWNAWVSTFAGDKVAARTPGDGKLAPIEDAPGSYVKLRLDAAGPAADQPNSAETAPMPATPKPSASTAASINPSPRQRAARPKS